MLERVLELFFHAKSGVFAGIFLLGTTGALVTATVSNGVATITITTASASPSASASASPSASASASPSHSPSASPSASPSTSPNASPAASPSDGSGSASACSAQADAVQTVNSGFSHFHTDLMHMRADAKTAKSIVENADMLLKDLRQSAVKAIHATSTCASAKDDDEDNDKNEDEDEDDSDNHASHEGNFVVVLFSNLQSLFGDRTVTVNTTTASAAPSTTPNTTFTGDAKQIADQAVAAMQLVFDDAMSQLAELGTPSPRATKSPKATKVDTSHGRSERSAKSGKADREGDDD